MLLRTDQTVRLSENPAYGFAVGRVRSLETLLLGRSRYEQLVQCRDTDAFLSVLHETNYGRYLDQSQSFDQAVQLAQIDYTEFLCQNAVDPWLERYFRLPVDIVNIKRLVKASLGGDRVTPLPGGSWSDSVLAQAVRGEQTAGDAGRAALLVAELLTARDDRPGGYEIDIAFDRLEQELALATVRASDFLVGLLRLRADLTNVLMVARLKRFGAVASAIEQVMLPGGTLDRRQLQAAFAADWELLPGVLGDCAAAGVAAEGIAWYRSEGSFLRWERLSREAELRWLAAARYAVFGHEPLAAFHLYRLNELRNLRGIFAAVRTGQTPALTRELVAYVE